MLQIAAIVWAVTLGGDASAAPPKAATVKQAKIDAFKKMVQELGKVPRSCRYKGKNLWGKVQVANSYPDIKIQIVKTYPGVP